MRIQQNNNYFAFIYHKKKTDSILVFGQKWDSNTFFFNFTNYL